MCYTQLYLIKKNFVITQRTKKLVAAAKLLEKVCLDVGVCVAAVGRACL